MNTADRRGINPNPKPMPDAYIDTHLTPLLRLYVLQVLGRFPGQTTELEALSEALHYLGMRTAHAALRQQLRWLRDAELIDLQEHDHWCVVVLTTTGHDVAEGLSRREGVATRGGQMWRAV